MEKLCVSRVEENNSMPHTDLGSTVAVIKHKENKVFFFFFFEQSGFGFWKGEYH